MGRPLSRSEVLGAAIVSSVFTWFFFCEYLPPFLRVSIPYDMGGYHYPLLDYAFGTLRGGRFPLWDPTIYCGLSFAGNISTGLFYPPTWLLFAVNLGREHLAFWSLEALAMAHVWLAFLLCYVWLRARGPAILPAAFGAAAYAFSGYLLDQLQHLGEAAVYAWIPLGLWGIDEAAAARSPRPLWKLAAASALALLAGYPPTWFVFAVVALAYALGSAHRIRTAVWTAGALAASLPIAAVALWPALPITAAKFHEMKYGAGLREFRYLAAYLLPNYADFAAGAPLVPVGYEYLYLGAPALFGLGCAVLWCRGRAMGPPAWMAAVSFAIITNVFGLTWAVLRHSSLLRDLCRDWYFLAGVMPAIAAVSAAGLDAFLRRPARSLPRWSVPAATCCLGAWAAWEIALRAGRGRMLVGWRSALYPAVLLVLFAIGMWVLRGARGRARAAMAAVLLLAAGIDYKAFGTGRQFDARPGSFDRDVVDVPHKALDDELHRKITAAPQYRTALDRAGALHPDEARAYGLVMAQGFDSMLPERYRQLLLPLWQPGSARLLDLDPSRHDVLRSLGVRYYFTSEQGAGYNALRSDPAWQVVAPDQGYFRVFELRDASPAYRWEPAGSHASLALLAWQPGRRDFRVHAPAAGRLVLVENFLPGWRAAVDGRPATLEPAGRAFQAVAVPAGDHRVAFEYGAGRVLAGAAISLAATLALCAFARRPKGAGGRGLGLCRNGLALPGER